MAGYRAVAQAALLAAIALLLQGCAPDAAEQAQDDIAKAVCDTTVRGTLDGIGNDTINVLGETCRDTVSNGRSALQAPRSEVENKCLGDGAASLTEKLDESGSQAVEDCKLAVAEERRQWASNATELGNTWLDQARIAARAWWEKHGDNVTAEIQDAVGYMILVIKNTTQELLEKAEEDAKKAMEEQGGRLAKLICAKAVQTPLDLAINQTIALLQKLCNQAVANHDDVVAGRLSRAIQFSTENDCLGEGVSTAVEGIRKEAAELVDFCHREVAEQLDVWISAVGVKAHSLLEEVNGAAQDWWSKNGDSIRAQLDAAVDQWLDGTKNHTRMSLNRAAAQGPKAPETVATNVSEGSGEVTKAFALTAPLRMSALGADFRGLRMGNGATWAPLQLLAVVPVLAIMAAALLACRSWPRSCGGGSYAARQTVQIQGLE